MAVMDGPKSFVRDDKYVHICYNSIVCLMIYVQ